MNLPAARIELAASTEESRYTLKAVRVDVENKRIMATNGHIAVVMPCEVSADDKSASISPDSFKQFRAMQKRSKSVPISIHTNGKATAIGAGETAEFELVTGEYPNMDAVIPKYDGPSTITLNAELLYTLAKAMTASGDKLVVSLTIKDAQSTILVKAGANPDAVGVIVPCRS